MDSIYQWAANLVASNEFLQGGFILGALTWVGYQIKTVPTFLWTKLKYYASYTVHFDEGSDFYRVFSKWLNDNHPQKFRNVEIKFDPDDIRDGATPVAEGSYSKSYDIKLRKLQFSDSNLIFYHRRWLWITKDRARLDTAQDVRRMFYNSYQVRGLFAKKAIDALCDEMLALKNAEIEVETRVRIFIQDQSYFQSPHYSDVVKTFDHLFFEQKVQLLADVNTFINQKEFYAKKGINYKRAFLLYGRGGTGKTSTALALAKHLNYDLYVINLAGVASDLELSSLARRIQPNAIVLLEDIDCILTARKVNSKTLNFGTVLNFLDGIYAPSGCIFVMTTNKPELLDEALIRKGRVDLALHIDFPCIAQAEAYMSDFYESKVVLKVKRGSQASAGMSSVQDICLQNKLEDAVKLVKELF